MNEMIERAAQAILESRSFYGGDPKKTAWVARGNSDRQDEARNLARAAIAAMREPSKAMVRKAEFTSDMNMMDCPTIGWECATKLWQAMIDAALKE